MKLKEKVLNDLTYCYKKRCSYIYIEYMFALKAVISFDIVLKLPS